MTRGLTIGVAVALLLTGCGATAMPGTAAATGTATASVPPPPPVPVHCVLRGLLPDPACTPGAVNPAASQATLKATVCSRGWATSQRPPQAYTEPLKARLVRAYGFPRGTSLRGFQMDHKVPLEAGGDPLAVANLWPEPIAGAAQKDKVERMVHQRICSGAITLATGQAVFLQDAWSTYR